MVWEPEVEELRRRAELSALGGTPDRIDRQHRLGRLTVRERIDGLLDPGSFHEVGALAGLGEYEEGELVDFTPASYVMGLGKIDGRTVAIGGEDFTIQGGSAVFPMQRSKGGLGGFCEELAVEYRVPLTPSDRRRRRQRQRDQEDGHHLPAQWRDELRHLD